MIGDAGLLGAVYLASFLISNVVTNNAAIPLLFPIAIEAAEQAGVDPILKSYDRYVWCYKSTIQS